MSPGMTRTLTSDPADMTPIIAQGRLGALKSRGVADDDPRVVECRQVLAYHRVHRAIDAEAGQLSPQGVDELVGQLRAAAVPR
jgi:hypothetical protein